jgi:hypothetical protein
MEKSENTIDRSPETREVGKLEVGIYKSTIQLINQLTS